MPIKNKTKKQQKTNKTQKTRWVGFFFFKPGFFANPDKMASFRCTQFEEEMYRAVNSQQEKEKVSLLYFIKYDRECIKCP